MTTPIMKNKKFLFSKKEHPCRQSLHLQPNQVRNPMVLFIPERLLIEHPFRLSDVRQNITLKTTLRAITALTHCFQNIEWCHGPSLEDEKSKDGVYNSYLHGYDAKWDEEERGGTELEREVRKNEKLAAKNMYQRKFEEKLNRFKKEKPSANFFALRVDKKKKTETCYRRTRAFLEYVMNDDESRAGIRFWIFTLDPKVNFGAGIERLILENQRDENDHDRKYRRGQRVKPLDPKPWESYYELKDKTVWSFGVCDGYTGNSDCRSKMKDIYHERKSLYHHENPANPHNVFSVERSFTLFEKDLRGVTDSGQATYQNYYTYQNGRMQWFPQNNRRFSKYFFEMSFEKMHPKLLFCMHLPTLDTCRLGLHELAKDFNFNPEVIQMFQMRDLVLSQADAKRDGDMHELEEMNQVLLRNIRKGEDLHGNPISEEKKARLLRAFRRRSMEAFINLWNEDSKISNICHVLISWYNSKDQGRRIPNDG